MRASLVATARRLPVRRQGQPRQQPVGDVGHRPWADLEAQQRLRLGRQAGGEHRRHLVETRVRGHDRQRPRRGCLGGDHAERLRERARHDLCGAGRQQRGELVVLEASRARDARRHPARGGEVRRVGAAGVEERREVAQAVGDTQLAHAVEVAGAQGGHERVERRGEVAEAHDDELGVGPRREDDRPGGGEQVDALVAQQLADVRDVRPGAQVEAQQGARDRVLVAGERASVAGAGGGGEQPVGDRADLGAGLRAGPGGERQRVDAGRTEAGARSEARVSEQLEHPAGRVPRADEQRGRARDALKRRADEAAGGDGDGVLEVGAVDLDGVGDAGRQAARGGQRAHDEVVDQGEVGAPTLRDGGDRAGVGGDVGLDVFGGALDEGLDREARVAILDVDGQQAAEVRLPDRHSDRLAQHFHAGDGAVGSEPADRVDPVELMGLPILREEVDRVARADERRHEPGVVDVGPRSAEQVAMEDEQVHGATAY
ncbi:MAG TPA: hypothetical protein VM266_14955 [Solirubrobacteraceae bacterium]|nr:hypothetical protein [Solirubrobacteraceae bacterium]